MTAVTLVAKVIRDNSRIEIEIPVLLTEGGILEPLLDYFLEKVHALSYGVMQKIIQAISLLIEYIAANQGCFRTREDLFGVFVQRLYSGTIENGRDPSWLYWHARSEYSTRTLIRLLGNFFDWLAANRNIEPVNPWGRASSYEEMLNWAAYHHRHDRAFLAHTFDPAKAAETAGSARHTPLKKTPSADRPQVKYFPEDRIYDLLFNGFIVPGRQDSPRIDERLNLRNGLLTVLEHGGGLRVCEGFQLYVHDEMPDPLDKDISLVRVYHPEFGAAPNDWDPPQGTAMKPTREAYLREMFGMRPRTQYAKGTHLHAGWKNSMLSDSTAKFMYVYWFPRFWGRLFKLLWDLYMLKIGPLHRSHPFAFISFDDGCFGEPYSIDAYRKAHLRAVERIGLIPSKMEGTTPYGHRHAYGRRLLMAEIDPVIRRICMHHKSIESQLVYMETHVGEVTRTLEEATPRLEGISPLQLPAFTTYGFEDVDPLGLFSGPHPLFKEK